MQPKPQGCTWSGQMLKNGIRCAIATCMIASGAIVLAQDYDPTERAQDEVIVRVADPFTIDDVLPLVRQHAPAAVVSDAIVSRKIYLLSAPGLDEDDFESVLEDLINPDPAVPNPNQPLLRGE